MQQRANAGFQGFNRGPLFSTVLKSRRYAKSPVKPTE
jgi:hypothetical protein